MRYLANEKTLQTAVDSEEFYDLCLLDASQVDARLLKKQIGRINSSKIGIIDASNSILDSNPKAFPLDSDKAVGDLIAHVAEQLTGTSLSCLLFTYDAADEEDRVDIVCGRVTIRKKQVPTTKSYTYSSKHTHLTMMTTEPSQEVDP
mgnify:CR=1 FL=1